MSEKLPSDGYTSKQLEAIAEMCYNANNAFCIIQNEETPRTEWSKVTAKVKKQYVSGVKFRIDNPHLGADSIHNEWLKEKELDGWEYGETKSVKRKVSPRIVPYDKLSQQDRKKHILFYNIVDMLKY